MRHARLIASAITVVGLLFVAVPGGRAQAPATRNDDDQIFLKIDDLATATGKGDVVVRLRPRKNRKKGYKITTVPMGVRLTPKAVTSNKNCEKIAIANAHNVVTFDIWNGEIKVIDHPDFGEIADVQYDWDCNLIIADMGMSSVGQRPRDGRVWMYTPGRDLVELAWRRKWSNPAFLDMDEMGTLYVVDKGAGPKIPGSGGWNFDAIYKMGPPKYNAAIKKFTGKGLDVSAFVHHPSGVFFIGNQDELLILENDKLRNPCAGTPFVRINGLALNSDLEVFVVDGFDIFGTSKLFRVDPYCNLQEIAGGRTIEGSQGLTAGLARR